MKPIIILVSFLFIQFQLFAQQRIGFELSSRLEDLSASVHIQKVIKSQFLIGTGILLNGNCSMQSNTYEFPDSGIHNPFPFVPDNVSKNGLDHQLYSYHSSSGLAISGLLMFGWLHEFSQYQGIRMNLNLRIGKGRADVNTFYASQDQSSLTTHQYSGSFTFQALSPEIYHTLRQSSKWTFYYGVRLPVYFSVFKKSYSPEYSFDIYKKTKIEFAIGLTRQVGKAPKQKNTAE